MKLAGLTVVLIASLSVAVQGGASAFSTKAARPRFRVSRQLAMTLDDDSQKVEDMTKALSLSVSGLEDESAEEAAAQPKKKKAKRVVSKDPRVFSGYNFKDEEGEYDVPFVDEYMWYRLQVRKSSENRFCENILELSRDKDSVWHGKVASAFYPKDQYPRFKGSVLTYSTKALIPGLVYIKTKMNYEIADGLEAFSNVYGFSKTRSGVVLPLPPSEAGSLEEIAMRSEREIAEKYLLLKKDEYVSIVSGPHQGKYGILQGTKRGKLEVILRGDYKDEWDLFDLKEVEHLGNPPEKKWNEMSAKEAIESLMGKDPHNPTIKALRKEGVLDDILYGGDRDRDRDSDGRYGRGREEGTGKRIRSIAKDAGDGKQDSWAPRRGSILDGDDAGNGSGNGSGSDGLDDFLDGLLKDGGIDGMLDGPTDSSSSGVSDLEEWGSSSSSSSSSTLWGGGSNGHSNRGMSDLRDLAAGDADLESFFATAPAAAVPATGTSGGGEEGPNINDYSDFGDYLAAVVDHAKQGGGGDAAAAAGGGGGGNREPRRYQAGDSVGSSSSTKRGDDGLFDGLDSLLDELSTEAASSSPRSHNDNNSNNSAAPDYAGYKVPELKALCKDRGLPVGGTKAELVDRLRVAGQ